MSNRCTQAPPQPRIDTAMGRGKQVIGMAGIAIFVLIPLEVVRAVCVAVTVIPILTTSLGEYVATGDTVYSNRAFEVIDTAGRSTVDRLWIACGAQRGVYI